MLKKLIALSSAALLLSLSACDKLPNNGPGATDNSATSMDSKEMMFTVTIENTSESTTPLAPGAFSIHQGANPLFIGKQKDAGLGLEALAEDGNPADLAAATGATVFNMPVGQDEPGPAMPGNSYSFSFKAKTGDKLSLATMYVQSNDGFYGLGGLDLFNEGVAMEGDITSKVMLWDGGTEKNQEPGKGADQAPRQAGPNTGEAESGMVQLMSETGDGFTYPSAIKVTISASAVSDAAPEAPTSPVAPEAPAQDVKKTFTVTIENTSASTTPLAPGVFSLHQDTNPLYTAKQKDPGNGLEALAEDGNPAGLASSTGATVFNTPVGASEPGPAMPGNSYSFTFEATTGDKLSFATMYVQSNDGFYGLGGLDLFNEGVAMEGDITSKVMLWDGGTEKNQEPGKGADQAPRQANPNTGEAEDGMIQLMSETGDGFTYPSAIKVTISAK